MEKRRSGGDDSYELGCHQDSASIDRTENRSLTSESIRSDESFEFCRTNSEASASAATSVFSDDNSCSETAFPICWKGSLKRLGMKQHRVVEATVDLELELMKEKLSKLLLGEDMSGNGKGVSSAVTLSNAITSLYASVFGQQHRLEPLHSHKKLMWLREMNCLLCVCDYIMEFSPTLQKLKDGTTMEVMSSRQRSDICINLPALRKLDAMLLDILDSFEITEFWYAEQGSISVNSAHSGSFRRIWQPLHTEEKWWVPVPCVPLDGLSDKSQKDLRKKRDHANQIHKAAMAINSGILAEMAIPESYMASLPKSGKASVGDTIYRCMHNTEKFSPDHLLDSLKISSEHEALELADKVEASIHIWRRKLGMAHSKSWDIMIKDHVQRTDKNHLLLKRAITLLGSLKQRYPGLSQTTLDTSRIQLNKGTKGSLKSNGAVHTIPNLNNKDVGLAVLESYSRVLEGLAFNVVSWIDDVLFVNKFTKNQA